MILWKIDGGRAHSLLLEKGMLNEDGKTFINLWRMDGEGRYFRLFTDEDGRMMLCELTGDTTAAEYLTDELICELTKDETSECIDTNAMEDNLALCEREVESLYRKLRQLRSLIEVVGDGRLGTLADAILSGEFGRGEDKCEKSGYGILTPWVNFTQPCKE